MSTEKKKKSNVFKMAPECPKRDGLCEDDDVVGGSPARLSWNKKKRIAPDFGTSGQVLRIEFFRWIVWIHWRISLSFRCRVAFVCLFFFLRLAGLWNASRINDLSRSFVFFVGVRPSYFGSGSTFRRESDAPLTSSSIDIYRLPSSARPYWVSLVFRSLLLLLLLLPSGFAFPVGSAGFTSRVESTFFCLFVFFGFGSGVYRVGGRNCHQKIKWATHTWSGTFQNNQFEKKTKKKRMSRSTAAGNSGSIRSGSFFFAFIPKLKQKKTRLRNSAHLSRWRFIGRWAGRKIHRKHLAASRSDNEKRTSTATPMMAPFYEGYRVFTSV